MEDRGLLNGEGERFCAPCNWRGEGENPRKEKESICEEREKKGNYLLYNEEGLRRIILNLKGQKGNSREKENSAWGKEKSHNCHLQKKVVLSKNSFIQEGKKGKLQVRAKRRQSFPEKEGESQFSYSGGRE